MKIQSLPFLNLIGKKGRSTALLVFAALLSFTVFTGALVLTSLKNGLESLELRLGADIIVVPKETAERKTFESILFDGNCTYFYMDKGLVQKVAAVEGIEKVSPQLFLASMSAGCCSVKLQMIGFDPETDFTVQPWISKTFNGTLEPLDILVGSKIIVPENKKLTFYGTECRVAGQLAPTGTGLDSGVYSTIDTIKILTGSLITMGKNIEKDTNPDDVVSSIQVKVYDEYAVEDVVQFINQNVPEVTAVQTKSMTVNVGNNMSQIAGLLGTLIFVVWILCLVVIVIVFTMIMNERKKEFAIMRVMGSTRRGLAGLVLSESMIINLAGSLLGIALGVMMIIPFQSSLEEKLALPFLISGPGRIALLALITLVVSLITGCLTSIVSVLKISKIDTGVILREGN